MNGCCKLTTWCPVEAKMFCWRVLTLMHNSDLVPSGVSQGGGPILKLSVLGEGGPTARTSESNYELGVTWKRMLPVEWRTTKGKFIKSKRLRSPQGLRIRLKGHLLY